MKGPCFAPAATMPQFGPESGGGAPRRGVGALESEWSVSELCRMPREELALRSSRFTFACFRWSSAVSAV